jgi:hypothetical protein
VKSGSIPDKARVESKGVSRASFHPKATSHSGNPFGLISNDVRPARPQLSFTRIECIMEPIKLSEIRNGGSVTLGGGYGGALPSSNECPVCFALIGEYWRRSPHLRWHIAQGDVIDDSQPIVPETVQCNQCNGEGKVANDEGHTPWSYWENLPESSKMAIRMGIIWAITCPKCGGAGRIGVISGDSGPVSGQ